MNLPIIFQALPKWDAPYNSTSLTIAKLLSRKRQVFYIEHPFSQIDRVRPGEKDRIKCRSLKPWDQPFDDFPNFYVIHPPLILPFNRLNNGVFYQYLLEKYLNKLWSHIDEILNEFNISEFGYINSFDPVYFNIKSLKRCVYKIYHCVDLIEGEEYIAKHGVFAEREAVKKSDHVIVTSEPLKQRLHWADTRVSCVKNASDFDHFIEPKEEPEEFIGNRRLKIVYSGSIGHRIDYGLIENLASENPDVDIFMIGPAHKSYFDGDRLMKYNNILFTGPKSYAELPAYVQHADLLLIPFLKNELTHHIYPLKINEYLATGNPILTTEFTDLNEFAGLLSVLKDSNELNAKLMAALSQESKEKSEARIKFASKNTWEERLEEWENILYINEL